LVYGGTRILLARGKTIKIHPTTNRKINKSTIIINPSLLMSNFKRKFISTKGNERTQPISKKSAMSADDLDDDFGFGDDHHHQQIDQGKNATKKNVPTGRDRDEDVEENPRKKKKIDNKDTTKTTKDSSSSSSITKEMTTILPPPPSAEIGDPEKLLEQIRLPSNIKPEEIPLQVWVKAAGRKGVLQQMVDKVGFPFSSSSSSSFFLSFILVPFHRFF
jgi:hypothetical protein